MPPTVPINHHRLGEVLILFFHAWKPNEICAWPNLVLFHYPMLKHARRFSTLLPSLGLLWTLCFAQGKRTGALLLMDKSHQQQTPELHSAETKHSSRETCKSVKNCTRASSQSVLVSLRREIQEKGVKRPCAKMILIENFSLHSDDAAWPFCDKKPQHRISL